MAKTLIGDITPQNPDIFSFTSIQSGLQEGKASLQCSVKSYYMYKVLNIFKGHGASMCKLGVSL